MIVFIALGLALVIGVVCIFLVNGETLPKEFKAKYPWFHEKS